MTLFIACLLIYGFELHWALNLVAFIVWLFSEQIISDIKIKKTMKAYLTKSSNVYGNSPYFLGITYGCERNIKDVAFGEKQIRIGLIWWHYVIAWR